MITGGDRDLAIETSTLLGLKRQEDTPASIIAVVIDSISK